MSDLPENWVSAVLSDISIVEMGQSPDSSTYNDKGNGLPFFQGKAEFGKLHPTVRKWCTDPKKIAEAGDILLSVRAPVGPTNLALEKCCIGRGLAAIRAKESIDQKYLLHYFRNIESWLSQQGTGTTFTAISGSFIRDLHVPVAPLDEQKRIAEKLDSLLTRVNSCQTHLERVPQILKRFRQSVLAAATSGRLTEDWREEKGIEYNWQKVKFTDIGTLGRGKSKHRPRGDKRLYGGDYPFIQTGDIAQSNGWITSHSQTYSEFGLKQSKLWDANTVCITIAANIANTAILSYPACFPDSVVGFVADPEKSLPQFVKWSIDVIKNDLESFAPATAQKNINLGILEEVEFDCPSLEEQAEIVRRVESLFAYAERLEARYLSASERVARLTPSLLAKGFRGELVEQDARDESAVELLEKVRKSKEYSQPQKAGPRKRKGSK